MRDHSLNAIPPSLFRPVIIIPAALLFLVAAFAMAWYALNVQSGDERRNLPDSGHPTQAVLFSASDIAQGQVLAGSEFEIRQLPPGKAPIGALGSAAEAQGHMALSPIRAGSPVLASQVSPQALAGISARVPQGYRAYAIAVSEADIAGGFLQVGDRVDLYLTLPGALFGTRNASVGRTDDRSKSTLLLQGVEVLAVGAKLKTEGGAETSARTVTLALRPQALARMALAARLGNVTFAIRNPADHTAADIAVADIGALVGESPKPPAPAPARAVAISGGIPVYAGRESNTVRVP
jgi:pilus assembly protein CpaB